LEEDEYFVLQDIKKPTAATARVATIQVNLVRILRFFSREVADIFPGRHKPGMDVTCRREEPSIYVSGMGGKSKPPPM
jgi:hypothetical protein